MDEAQADRIIAAAGSTYYPAACPTMQQWAAMDGLERANLGQEVLAPCGASPRLPS